MKELTHISWEDVFTGWRDREANNPEWIRHAKEVGGWPDWESWRLHTANAMGLENRTWTRHEFTDPYNEIPKMLVGPYPGWQKDLEEKNVLSFEQFMEVPTKYEQFHKHSKIQSIIESLPFNTEFIGLKREDTQQIVCIEGHHRAAAITLAKKEGRHIDFNGTTVTLALATLPKEEVHILNDVLNRGTRSESSV